VRTLTKKQIYGIHEKCVNLVKRKPAEFFSFRKMKASVGLCNWTDIELDYRRDLLSTAYHECVHYLFPDYSESMVKYTESRIVNVCDSLDLAYFLKILSNKLYKSELQKRLSKQKKSFDIWKKIEDI
jgi:hypothetical protein